MRTSTRRLLRSLPLLAALGCGGGSDGSPPDTPVIILSQSALTVIEGTPDTVTVVLDAAPPGNVSVTLSSAGLVTLLPTTLDFTPANFATPKLVVVTPIQDIDLAAGSDTVTATAAGLVTVKIPVAIADNDSQAVVLDSTLLSILEGDSVSYDVKLAYQPLASVNVTLTPTDTFVVVTPTTLNFTPADYATPKSVKVRAKQDLDLLADTLHIVASVPSGQSASIPVSITDDDIQAILVDSTQIAVVEGDSGVLHARLAFQPSGGVAVAVASLDNTAATPSPSVLNFTSIDWATPKSITVHGIQDVDLTAEATTIRLTSGGVPTKDVPVTVSDDDSQSLNLGADTLNIVEGDTIQFTVALSAQPAGPVSVGVASFVPSAATVSPATLDFTTADYFTPKQVTVVDVVDPSANSKTGIVRLSLNGNPDRDVTVNVADNGQQGIVSAPIATIQEGTSLGLIAVYLSHQPPSDVTVSVTSLDTSKVQVETTTLTFTPANWDVQQTFHLTGVQDDDLLNDSTIVRLSSPGVPNTDIRVYDDDDDTQAFIVTPDTIVAPEGTTVVVTVRLAFRPSTALNPQLFLIDTSVATLSAATLAQLTPANWDIGVTFSVTGTEDADTTTDSTDLLIQAAGVNIFVKLFVPDND